MRNLFVFLLVEIVLFGCIRNTEIEKIEENKNYNFKTFTSAVCENVGEVVHCKDEVFVNCSGNISKAGDFAECNGIKINVPKITGFAVFEKGWNETRR